MYPWISWELVADTLGFAEHTLGTTAMVYYLWGRLDFPRDNKYCLCYRIQ
jgi:hypothetical protein